MKRVLIIGATSAIAQETARRSAQRGDRLFLLGRNEKKLQILSEDLKIRGAAQADFAARDLSCPDSHAELLEQAEQALGYMDIVLIAYGTLGDQTACEQDFQQTARELNINFLSVVSFLTWLANYFEARKQGSIVVLSSVAGDRGRQSNYIYGAAKGGLSIFLQGLRNRLHKAGVQVLTVKPGFTDTPMTAAMPKNFLFVSPARVAKDIEQAIAKRKKVLYTPWFWQWIMLIIKLIPERIFVNLKL
ncbi:MAG: SDR family oxidoreductase [Gammaproteobacteria bacterium]|nr:SDR family oxidoreductase [Gammaproteobacteria bacterium]